MGGRHATARSRVNQDRRRRLGTQISTTPTVIWEGKPQSSAWVEYYSVDNQWYQQATSDKLPTRQTRELRGSKIAIPTRKDSPWLAFKQYVLVPRCFTRAYSIWPQTS